MPVGGRKPTPEGVPKSNRHATMEWTEVENVPNEDHPPLPEYRGLNDDPRRDRRFRKSTRKYYMNIARLPHTALWSDTEWDFLVMTCEVRESYFDDDKKSPSYLSEMRAREKVMGTTPDYRRDIRIRYVDKVEGSSRSESYLDEDYGDL